MWKGLTIPVDFNVSIECLNILQNDSIKTLKSTGMVKPFHIKLINFFFLPFSKFKIKNFFKCYKWFLLLATIRSRSGQQFGIVGELRRRTGIHSTSTRMQWTKTRRSAKAQTWWSRHCLETSSPTRLPWTTTQGTRHRIPQNQNGTRRIRQRRQRQNRFQSRTT